jgi:hypothetical protein
VTSLKQRLVVVVVVVAAVVAAVVVDATIQFLILVTCNVDPVV